MKTQSLYTSRILHRIVFLCIAFVTFVSCQEKVDISARYVFREQTILDYLNKHEDYSEYVRLLWQVPVGALSSSTVAQLLSARGHYTVFAPTNEAIQDYLDSLVVEGIIQNPRWDAFSDSTKLDSIRKVIVYNSIMDSGDDEDYFETNSFPTTDNAEFPIDNMNGRKLTVHYTDSVADAIYIDQVCPIDPRNRDIPTINGVVHQIGRVISPTVKTLADMFRKIIEEETGPYLVTAKVVRACGLLDTLDAKRDERYENLRVRGEIPDYKILSSTGLKSLTDGRGYLPEHRKYGFTVFSETDEFWEEELGKSAKEITPEDVQQWVVEQNYYPEALANNDYRSEQNTLYHWITYHILPYRLMADRLVIHYSEYGYSLGFPLSYATPVMEHYCTLGERRLLRLYESRESEGVFLNRFPEYDNGRTGTGHEKSCMPSRVGSRVFKENPDLLTYSMENGLIYSIDAPIACNDSTRNNMGRCRLRYEGASFFPELMNNDIRRMPLSDGKHQNVLLPTDAEYKYLDNLSMNEGVYLCYYNAYRLGWGSFQGDEIKGVGRYEFLFRLPPVPKRGTYELRYRVLSNGDRGVAQLYFGSNPDKLPVTGIPIDLTIGGSDRRSGWESETDDQDYNAEVDKRMRNNGFMKGELGVTNTNIDTRCDSYRHVVRRIITRQTMDPKETYYLKIKSVLDTDVMEFYMDAIEFCPKEVYDNPNIPEDIW